MSGSKRLAGDLRLWIGVLALSCFGTGVAVGALLLPGGRAAEIPAADGPFEDYARLLGERFELSAERRELLAVVLEQYRADMEQIRGRHMAELTSAMEPELRELGLRYRALVRDKVLPKDGRAEFDRLASDLR